MLAYRFSFLEKHKITQLDLSHPSTTITPNTQVDSQEADKDPDGPKDPKQVPMSQLGLSREP